MAGALVPSAGRPLSSSIGARRPGNGLACLLARPDQWGRLTSESPNAAVAPRVWGQPDPETLGFGEANVLLANDALRGAVSDVDVDGKSGLAAAWSPQSPGSAADVLKLVLEVIRPRRLYSGKKRLAQASTAATSAYLELNKLPRSPAAVALSLALFDAEKLQHSGLTEYQVTSAIVFAAKSVVVGELESWHAIVSDEAEGNF